MGSIYPDDASGLYTHALCEEIRLPLLVAHKDPHQLTWKINEQIVIDVSGIAENVIDERVWDHFHKKTQGKCVEVRRYGWLLHGVVFDAPFPWEYQAVP